MCTTTGTIYTVPVAASTDETAPRLTIPLEPVDQVTVTTLVDNVTDLLAADTGPARRPFIGDAVRGPSPCSRRVGVRKSWRRSTASPPG